MNFLPIILIAMLLGGDKLSSLKEFLARIDFQSFAPILKVLGIKENAIDFLCSEKFSSLLSEQTDLKSLLPVLLSLFNSPKEEEQTSPSASEQPCTFDEAISPIKKVAPTEVEETFNAYFS